MVAKGSERFTLDFFLNFASRRATQAGILSAWVGSLLVMLVTAWPPCRSASLPASILRNTPSATG
jgi:ABC-type phosphate transport system permease subunit